MRYAAIDIGTVTARLLIADVDAAGLHPLTYESNIVNLGAGVDATGALDPQAIDRVCATVERYMEKVAQASSEKPVQVRCLATSASRDASNADVFVERMAQLGVEMMVISGVREAELAFLGASADFPGEALLVSDIGGGSTELIAGVAGEGIVHSHSFNIGSRRATERCIVNDPPTKEELRAIADWAAPQFATFFEELKQRGFTYERYIAVAGTSTTVVSIAEAMDPYDRDRVHGARVSAGTLDAVVDRLAGMALEQRCNVVGLQPNRAPIIVAGMTILQQVLKASGLSSFTTSETDILEGIVMDAARTDGVLAC